MTSTKTIIYKKISPVGADSMVYYTDGMIRGYFLETSEYDKTLILERTKLLEKMLGFSADELVMQLAKYKIYKDGDIV